MPLSKAQIQILTNPSVRQRLQTKAQDFKYADTLLRDVGEGCPRLPKVYERIFSGLSKADAAWLTATFPGHKFAAASSNANTSQPPPPSPQPKSIVHRAIDVLQSYKKTQ